MKKKEEKLQAAKESQSLEDEELNLVNGGNTIPLGMKHVAKIACPKCHRIISAAIAENHIKNCRG